MVWGLPLEEAVFQALQTNPDIKEKSHNLDSVKKERDLALSAYYPTLSASAGVGEAKEDIIPAYRVSGSKVTRTDSSVVASMNLFSGFHTLYDSEGQQHRSHAAKAYLQESKSAIALKTIESFIMMMKHKTMTQISHENVSSHRDIFEKLKEKEKSGIGKASDLGFASGRLTLARVNAVVHENNFVQAKVLFETIFGKSIDVTTLQEPHFDYTLPKSLEDAALMAWDYNPSLQVSRYNIKNAQSNYKKSRSVYYPTLDIELKKSWFDETGGYEYGINSTSAMIYLRYNFFNGFADQAKVEKDFAIYLQNSQNFNTLKRTVTQKLGTAWVSAIKIKEQLDLLKKMRTYSKKTLEDYYSEFGIGKRTLLDIINVENDYNNARQSYESAKYDLLLSKFRILKAMGGLVDYFMAKADTLSLRVDERLVDEKSVYDIIKEMDKKIQANEPFLPYDESNHSSLDKRMNSKSAEDELDW
jgi:adhesin transport system outer membrane protein